MQRNNVVLPHPDGPTIVRISRSPRSKSMPRKTSSAPYRLASPRTRMRVAALRGVPTGR